MKNGIPIGTSRENGRLAVTLHAVRAVLANANTDVVEHAKANC